MINRNPEVSVIMPVYNAEKFLDENIPAILNQSFENFEFIIIDDESKDKSWDIIKKYARKDERIIPLRNEKNLGCVNTRNKGLRIAKGKYIAVMDPDDISLKDRFKIQVNYLNKHPEIFLLGGSAIVIDEEGNRLGIFLKHDNHRKIERRLRDFNLMLHPSVMHRNTKEFFYREKFIISDDYDFLLRILSANKKITNVPEFLIKFRINKGSFTFTKKNPDYFFRKAKDFYLQRIRTGRDDYEKLDINKIKPKKVDQNKLYSKILIAVKFQDNQMREVRKEIKNYIKNYSLDRQIIIYYLLSFFPIKITKFLRDTI
jgi:glycosyltransferase involved in cell wall biosynthesis